MDLDVLRELPNMGYLDMGLMSDLRQAREVFPEARRAVLYSPIKLEEASPEELRADMQRIHNELAPCDLVMADIQATMPDERVRELLDICRELEERRWGMATLLGSGDYVYEERDDWARLPEGWSLREVADVAVDGQDRVYVFSRGEHPVTVFDRDGTFLASWGKGLFTRPHGATFGPDGALYCVDDGAHCIRKCSPDGQVLMTIGVPGQPAPRGSGLPFCQPTKVAFDPQSGDLYISDGYGNARVHKFSAEGQHLFSWGEYGTDPSQFNLVHTVCTDGAGRVYIADRENHRLQVFDAQGIYLEQWNNLHRPCGLCLHGGLAYVGQLHTSLPVNATYPYIGACVSIHDLSGRRLARLGEPMQGIGPGQFVAPHGLAVDSRGDIYVGEVSYAEYGRWQDPPREVRSLRKLVRLDQSA